MDVTQRGIITLIRSSLAGEALTLPEGFDLEEAYPQIVRHGILTVAYDGAVRCGVDKKLPVMQKLFQAYVKCTMHSEGQMAALEKVCNTLDERGFDHLLLKGSLLKHMYPRPELRQMGDADILIRKAQYEAIGSTMKELGFCNTAQGFYDYGWKSPELYVELHHRFSNPYNTDFNGYLEDGWKRAKKQSQSSCRYEYTAEDHYIYIFIHFTKHYRDGGVGLRHAADLWVFRKANPDLDEAYLTAELEKIGLSRFHENVLRMLAGWFEDAQEDDVTEFIGRVLFYSGAFGTEEATQKAVSLRAANKAGSAKTAKIPRVLHMLFPGRFALQPRYPVLKKWPVLLPVIWPVRWITGLLFRRDNVKLQQKYLGETTEETIESYRQALSYVGLNYTIKD